MKNVKSALIAQTVISVVMIICITGAACYFKKPLLLLWYIFVPLGISITSSDKKGDSA